MSNRRLIVNIVIVATCLVGGTYLDHLTHEHIEQRTLRIGRFIGNCDTIELIAKQQPGLIQDRGILKSCKETRAKYAAKLE